MGEEASTSAATTVWQDGGEVYVQEGRPWRPTRVEREAVCRYAVMGVPADEIATVFDRTEEQVKRLVASPASKDALDELRDEANSNARLALSMLQSAAPGSVTNIIATASDPRNRNCFAANKYIVETTLAPMIERNRDQSGLELTINLSQQVATQIGELTETFRSVRMARGTDSLLEDPHLVEGSKAYDQQQTDITVGKTKTKGNGLERNV